MEIDVELSGVTKSFGERKAVDQVSLAVARGEFLTLLGPSGCGKTTILRLIAGFEEPDEGSIRIAGRDVAGVPPYRRDVNTVFQHYALFPHMNVFENVAFGLEMRHLPQEEISRKVEEALGLVRLSGFEQRSTPKLSGGEMQRVALARALVLRPAVLLLDEPLGALDLKLRKEMQVELKDLQEKLGITFLFVTHDQEEALIMSDRIAVMRAGRIEQVGDAVSIYERPETRFVADFMGVRNFFRCQVERLEAGRAYLRSEGGTELVAAPENQFAVGEEALIAVRPEKIRVRRAASPASREPSRMTGGPSSTGREPSPRPPENRALGKLLDEIYLGNSTQWVVQLNQAETLVVHEAPSQASEGFNRGDSVELSWAASACLKLREA